MSKKQVAAHKAQMGVRSKRSKTAAKGKKEEEANTGNQIAQPTGEERNTSSQTVSIQSTVIFGQLIHTQISPRKRTVTIPKSLLGSIQPTLHIPQGDIHSSSTDDDDDVVTISFVSSYDQSVILPTEQNIIMNQLYSAMESDKKKVSSFFLSLAISLHSHSFSSLSLSLGTRIVITSL